MSDTAALLGDSPYVNEIAAILQNNKLDAYYRNLAAVVGYVEKLENELIAVNSELKGVKQQISNIEDNKSPFKAAVVQMAQNLESELSKTRERLNEIKSTIIEGAKAAVAAFKEKGLVALDAALRFLKVKDNLVEARDNLQEAVASADKSIAKIDAVSAEYHEVGKHLNNMFRAFSGNDALEDRKPNGNIAKAAQSPYRAANAMRSKTEKGVTSLIGKVEQVEEAAAKIPQKEKKPSILKGIKDFTPPARSADNSSKVREASL